MYSNITHVVSGSLLALVVLIGITTVSAMLPAPRKYVVAIWLRC